MAQQLLMMVPLLGLSVAGIVLLAKKRRRKAAAVVIPKDHAAFMERFELLPPPPPPPPAAPHPLSGLTFAAEEMFDVEGHVTGFGNAAWRAAHEGSPAASTAYCVAHLVSAGATLVGTTAMDDLGLSLLGASKEQKGAPVNPLAPQHIPGGSSSGSAVAVAAHLVEFAIGVDTLGGVRVPAANCGVLGFRPTHGAVNMGGVLPLCPSLDTVGLLAHSPEVLRQVGHILLGQPFTPPRLPSRLLIADDLFDMTACPRAPITETVIAATEKGFGPIVKYKRLGDLLKNQVPSLTYFTSSTAAAAEAKAMATTDGSSGRSNGDSNSSNATAEAEALAALVRAATSLLQVDFHAHYGQWLAEHKPKLPQHVAQQTRQAAAAAAAAAELDEQSRSAAPPHERRGRDGEVNGVVQSKEEGGGGRGEVGRELQRRGAQVKAELRSALNEELKEDRILVVPVVWDLPPKVNASRKALEEYESGCLTMLAAASMAGLPQVVLPVGQLQPSGLPLSVGFVARSGADRFLLDAARMFIPLIEEAFKEWSRKSRSATANGDAAQPSSAAAAAAGVAVSSAASRQGSGNSAAEEAKAKGNAAYKELRMQDAVDCYTQAIRLNPNNATYYANRAMAHLNLQNFEQVEADCSAALRLDKKCVKAMLRRATAREFLGFYAEAYSDFREALVYEPSNKTALEGIRRMEESGVL